MTAYPLPSLVRVPTGEKLPCRRRETLGSPPCGVQAVYIARWYGGRTGTALCQRPVCERHGKQWAKRRGVEVPA